PHEPHPSRRLLQLVGERQHGDGRGRARGSRARRGYDQSRMEAKLTSFREAKKAKLRVELTRAAVELSKQQGFDATTAEQIAARVDSSERTFFRYFRTKEDVLFGDTPERLAALREQLESADPGADPVAVLEQALIAQISSFTNFDDAQLEADCAA